MLLYSKEGQVITIGTGLQEIKPSYNKGQNTTTFDWRGYYKLKEAKYFNKLDLIWRYKNVWIKKENEWNVAFLTNMSLFKPQVIYFRLCNLPEMFQRTMNSIF